MKRRIGLWFLKLIGIGIFVHILSQIDRTEVLRQLQSANPIAAIASLPLLYAMYFCKAKRFCGLVEPTGTILTTKKSWKIYNIGIFLANITPGKVGELGKAAYLKAMGIGPARSIAITVLDRLFDVACIVAIAIVGFGILLNWKIALSAVVVGYLGLQILWWTWHRIVQTRWCGFLRELLTKTSIVPASVWTLLSWIIYFAWAVLVAGSLGIVLPVHILVFIMTFTGVIAMLPIAPLGLGTRDAALVFFLTPYGVASEQAVSLALLMFVHILLSGALGGYYFLAKQT